jgi:curli biogenesis system outer membrane secretion channel CsgG
MKLQLSPAIALAVILTGLIATPVLHLSLLANAQGLSGPGAEQIKPREKRRIAVLDFDFSSISNMGLLSGFGGEGAAKGVSNLLINQLVKDGNFIVIERGKIDAVMAEQNLGASGRVEPTTAAQIGRILGVDAVLIGSVTKFDLEDKSRGLAIGSLFGGGDRKQIATVQITSRLVSTTTAEILAIAEGTGQADQKNNSVKVFGIGTDSNSDSKDRILSEAAEKAIAQLSTQLTAAGPKLAALPAIMPNISAVIADITGNEVTLNQGGQAGLRPGMILSVERVIKQIKDPTTGKVLKIQTQSIGRLQLTEVDAQSSVGKILAGQGGIRVGDRTKALK